MFKKGDLVKVIGSPGRPGEVIGITSTGKIIVVWRIPWLYADEYALDELELVP